MALRSIEGLGLALQLAKDVDHGLIVLTITVPSTESGPLKMDGVHLGYLEQFPAGLFSALAAARYLKASKNFVSILVPTISVRFDGARVPVVTKLNDLFGINCVQQL